MDYRPGYGGCGKGACMVWAAAEISPKDLSRSCPHHASGLSTAGVAGYPPIHGPGLHSRHYKYTDINHTQYIYNHAKNNLRLR